MLASRICTQRGGVLANQGRNSILDSNIGCISEIGPIKILQDTTYKSQGIRLYVTKVQTHYEVLGVSPRSTQAEIKGAYYKLSKLHHPDVTKVESDHVKFSQISAAYGILGNRQSRRRYDTGMLNPDDVYSGNMGPATEAEYREFMRQRGQFAKRGEAPTGRSHIYDFDKFYEMHYGNTVKHQHKARRSRNFVDKDMERAKSKYYMSMGFAVAFVSVLVFFIK